MGEQVGPVLVTPESWWSVGGNRALSTRDSARVPGKAINKRQGNHKWELYGPPTWISFPKFLPQPLCHQSRISGSLSLSLLFSPTLPDKTLTQYICLCQLKATSSSILILFTYFRVLKMVWECGFSAMGKSLLLWSHLDACCRSQNQDPISKVLSPESWHAPTCFNSWFWCCTVYEGYYSSLNSILSG